MTKHRNPNQPENHAESSDGISRTASLESANTQALATAVMVLMRTLIRPHLFTLGQITATPGAIDLLDRAGINASDLLGRHQCGDWGVVCAADAAENMRALQDGNRLLSAYEIGQRKEKLWIITEHDRSVTTLLLPQEY
jgi:hypothetical protein